jgi:hypothetical protein
MNAFGIDYQRTLTVVSLREGGGAGALVRSVGDGQRALIPNAVRGEALWGSRALPGPAADLLSGSEPLRDEPWTDAPGAPEFWRGIYGRLYSYLGRLKPGRESGYPVVVALQAPETRPAAVGVEALARAAGFADPCFIPAPHALLCRWLAEQAAGATGERAVVAVAVGDTSTLVAAYRVREQGGRLARVTAWSGSVRRIESGQAGWVNKVLDCVNSRLTESTPVGTGLPMRVAAMEFGARLFRAADGRQVQWTGPFHDRMYEPLLLGARDCSLWPEVKSLAALPEEIRRAAEKVGGTGGPDLVLLGGVGAGWPFVRDLLADAGPVWASDTPQEDVARGAAWWPEVGESNADVLLREGSLDVALPPPLAAPVGEPAPPGGLTVSSPVPDAVSEARLSSTPAESNGIAADLGEDWTAGVSVPGPPAAVEGPAGGEEPLRPPWEDDLFPPDSRPV